MLIARLATFVKATLAGAFKAVTSKEGLKSLYLVSLYRNALYLMVYYLATGLTGFLFWAVTARLYPAEEVGLASSVISAMGLLALLSTLGLDYGIIRFFKP
jgi:O-antigen/teichoic acid export membrane protein